MASKIDQHELGPRVLELVTKDSKTLEEVQEILRGDGYDISYSTIHRWLKKRRQETEGEVENIVRRHVQRVVPEDLTALEGMEKDLLDWSKEEPPVRSERISAWDKVEDSVEVWANQILSAYNNPEDRKKIVKTFVQQCLTWLQEDMDNRSQRIRAMKMATQIIDTKLKYSGIIGGEAQGNIFIMKQGQRQDAQHPATERPSGPREVTFGKAG